MWRRGFSLLRILALVALVGAALLLSVARVLLPQLGAHRSEVQRWVSDAVAQPVQIDGLDAEWRGLYPVLHLRGVRLLDREQQHTRLRFTELHVVVDPYAALYRWRLQVRALRIIGARLAVERRADGTLSVAGFEDMPEGKPGDMSVLAWLATQPELSLLRSEIHWHDARSSAAPLVFSAVDLQLENNGTSHRLSAATQLPASLGKRLRAVLDFRGDFSAPTQWSGKVYLRGAGLQVAGWLGEHGYAGLVLRDGTADAELWGGFSALQLRSLTGAVQLRGLRLVGESAPALDELSGRLRFTRDAAAWRVDAEDLHLTRRGQAWPVSGFSLRQRNLADGAGEQFDADFDFLRLQDVSALVERGTLLPEPTRALLAGLAANGDIHELRAQAQVRDAALLHYQLTARLAGLSTHAWQHVPALSGISGVIEGDERQGQLQFDSQQAGIELPDLFRQPLALRQLSGIVEWQHYPLLWRIQSAQLLAENADVRTETRFSIDLPQDGKPFLDLQTRFADGDVTAVSRYLPTHIMPPGVVAWLDRAFLGGRVRDGTVLFHGRLTDFPFDENNGVFLVSAAVENAGLDYGAGWPRIDAISAQVNFLGRGLSIDAASGRVYGARLGPTQVSIADLRHGELQLDGSAQSSNADLLRFLRESPLSAHYRDMLAGLNAGGDSHLSLSLNLPLTPHESVPLLLGRVDFNAATLSFPDLDLALEDLSGPLDFTATGLFSTGLQAKLFGSPVTITAQAQDSGANPGTRVDLQGRMEIKTLAQRQPSAYWRLLDGGSDCQVSLLFAHAANPASVHIESALRGVAVHLPAPLGKAAKDARAFSVDVPLTGSGRSVISGDYADVLRGAFEMNRAAGKSELVRGEVRLGGVPAQLPDGPGLRLAGELPQFDYDDWHAALANGQATDAALQASGNVTAVDIHVQEFKASNYTLNGLHLAAERQPQRWQVDVQSDALTGRIQVPVAYPGGGPVIMALDDLKLDAGKGDNAAGKATDPRQMPALQVAAKHFEYRGADFGSLTLSTTRSPAGMHVDKAMVESPQIKATASGDWTVDKATQSSRFTIDVSAPQLGLLLGKFGYVGNIKDGATTAKIQAEWPGSPARFALERLQGSLRVDIRNGRFVDIEPGAGRVFGLLSINELQRRLRLDFSDLFKKGFSFDEISGDFMLASGDAFTSNTVIQGPAARIDITGRTGLVRRDYEQLITVTPHLTSSLPLAGAIANPGVGAALFLAQKLFENQIDSITRYQYTVNGSWDKPLIARVSQSKPVAPNQP